MKFTPFKTVKLEKTIELKTDAQTVIKRLQSLGEVCNATTSSGYPIDFYCTNSGRITVEELPALTNGHSTRYLLRRRSLHHIKLNSVRAQVKGAGGGTLIKIYSAKNIAAVVSRVIVSAIIILSVTLIIADAIISGKGLSNRDLIIALLGLVFVASNFIDIHREKVDSDPDLKIMIEEIERRADAVERWDELKPLDFD